MRPIRPIFSHATRANSDIFRIFVGTVQPKSDGKDIFYDIPMTGIERKRRRPYRDIAVVRLGFRIANGTAGKGGSKRDITP